MNKLDLLWENYPSTLDHYLKSRDIKIVSIDTYRSYLTLEMIQSIVNRWTRVYKMPVSLYISRGQFQDLSDVKYIPSYVTKSYIAEWPFEINEFLKEGAIIIGDKAIIIREDVV